MHVNAHLDIDMVALEAEDTVTVMLDLVAPPGIPGGDRASQAVVAVLDRSGSMGGARLGACKRALADLVGRLDEHDAFGVVAFDHQAQVIVPTERLESLGRQQVRAAITAIGTGGSTDLSSGFLRGLREAHRVNAPGGATLIVLSDGHANAGIVDPGILRELASNAARQRITTSSIGIGTDYDDAILSELAIGGGGNHTFAMEGDAAAAAIAGEVEGLLSKTVQAASLRIKPISEVAQIGVLNDLPSHPVPGGIEVELGDFYAGERRRLLVQITVPALAGLGLAQVADLALTSVAVPSLESQTVTIPVSVNVVPADVAAGRVPDPQVQHEKLLLDVQRIKKDGESALRRGDLSDARTLLSQARQDLRGAPATMQTDEVLAEIASLEEAIEGIDNDAMLTRKRLSASRAKRSRGHSRTQGGEAPQPPAGE